MAAGSHSNAGAQWPSLNTFRLNRIAAPARAMASEQLAALEKLPAEAGPPLNAAVHSELLGRPSPRRALPRLATARVAPVGWSLDAAARAARGSRESNPLSFLGPSDTSGVDGLEKILVTPDGRSSCYTFFRNLGTLFVVTGLR